MAWTRRRAARARDLLERRLDLALEAGGMTTWLWDARRDALTWDGRAAGVYGGTPPRSSRRWLEHVHPDDRDEVLRALGRREPFRVVHRTATGEPRWLELRGEPVLTDEGELLGTAGVVVDVTAAHAAATELAESRAALERILDVAPAFVADAGGDADEVPGRICEAAATVFGCDACSIFVVDGDGAIVRPLVCRPEGLIDLGGPAVGVADLPLLVEQLARHLPATVSADRGDRLVQAMMADAGMRSGVVAQLAGSLFLTLWWADDVVHGLERLAAVRRFADQAAVALAQARAAVARREVDVLNATLQAGLLPTTVVRDPSVRVAARYRPSERRILLGGDFYDVVERPDGTVAFLVGDVTGHGPGPAAVGAALRAGWRALALEVDDPAAWLRAMGASLASYDMGPELLVTTFTGLVALDRRSMVVANAGHPLPVLLAPGGAEPVGVGPGIALGLAKPGVGVVATTLGLRDRWRLLLHTDGVIEVRTGDDPADRFGTDGLTSWLAEHGTGTDDDDLLDALVAHLEDVSVEPFADDVTVLLLGQRRG